MREKFEHVKDVLRYAHRWEAAELIKSPSVQRSSRSSDPLNMTPIDHVLQAEMILALVRRSLLSRQILTLRMYYIQPADAFLRKRKADLIKDRAEWICRGSGRPVHFIEDMIRKWTGQKPHHILKWWSDHLKVSERTLNYWATSKKPDSVCSVVERELEAAHDRLADPMREAGYFE